jgi:hypothetical protein
MRRQLIGFGRNPDSLATLALLLRSNIVLEGLFGAWAGLASFRDTFHEDWFIFNLCCPLWISKRWRGGRKTSSSDWVRIALNVVLTCSAEDTAVWTSFSLYAYRS